MGLPRLPGLNRQEKARETTISGLGSPTSPESPASLSSTGGHWPIRRPTVLSRPKARGTAGGERLVQAGMPWPSATPPILSSPECRLRRARRGGLDLSLCLYWRISTSAWMTSSSLPMRVGHGKLASIGRRCGLLGSPVSRRLPGRTRMPGASSTGLTDMRGMIATHI